MKPCLIFLQKRTHRAGAQTCLTRLLRHPVIHSYKPILVCESDSGWLWETANQLNITCIAHRFPSSRSLTARLYGNRKFAESLARKIKSIHQGPYIVHANDHLEGLLGLALANKLNAAKAIFLRSSGMTQRDYTKYHCGEYEFIATVAEHYQQKFQQWDSMNTIELIHDGIEQSEFFPPVQWSSKKPEKILVVGSEIADKGWRDLIDALVLLENHQEISSIEFEFTGNLPDRNSNDLDLDRLHKHRCHFIGRVNNFTELLRQQVLVITPSRKENFGTAAVETIAAGVPLLSSRTGVVDQILNDQYLFDAYNPNELYQKLFYILSHWKEIQYPFLDFQKAVLERFLIDIAAEKLDRAYKDLLLKRQL